MALIRMHTREMCTNGAFQLKVLIVRARSVHIEPQLHLNAALASDASIGTHLGGSVPAGCIHGVRQWGCAVQRVARVVRHYRHPSHQARTLRHGAIRSWGKVKGAVSSVQRYRAFLTGQFVFRCSRPYKSRSLLVRDTTKTS